MKTILLLSSLLTIPNFINAHHPEDHKPNHIHLDNKTTQQLTFELIALIAQWHEPVNDITIENVTTKKDGILNAHEEQAISIENAIQVNAANPDWLVKQILVCTTATEKICALYNGAPDNCGSIYEIIEANNTLTIEKLQQCAHHSSTTTK